MSATADRRDPGVYRRIITGNDLEHAALDLLRARLPELVAEVERQRGQTPGERQTPRGYIVASQFAKWPEDQLPVVVVISPGLVDRPRRAGDGRARARWALSAGVINSAATIDRTRENTLDYVAAIRTLIAQEQSLGGLAVGVDWIDEDYIPPFPYGQTRSLFGAQAIFTVTVDDVVSYGAGPGGPWGPPPAPATPTDPTEWPPVKVAAVTVAEPVPPRELTLANTPHREE
jgi:hypothetical protein